MCYVGEPGINVMVSRSSGKSMKYVSEKILRGFYNEYFRSPRIDEFVALGGNMQFITFAYDCYEDFLVSFGYRLPGSAKTYEVVDEESGMIIFTGTSRDIAKELNINISTVTRTSNQGTKLRKYPVKIRVKEFRRS